MKMTRLGFLYSLIAWLPLSAVAQAQAGVEKITPDQLPDEVLRGWLSRPRIPVLESEDPLVQACVAAMLRKERLEMVYLGGSSPGTRRIISPGLVFRLEDSGPVYMSGYCHFRREERTFRVDRMKLASRMTWSVS
jgi:predicted DNA-binding transcriptional regulator YafY